MSSGSFKLKLGVGMVSKFALGFIGLGIYDCWILGRVQV